MDKYEKFEKDVVSIVKKIKSVVNYLVAEFKEEIADYKQNINELKAKIKVRTWLYKSLLVVHKIVILLAVLFVGGLNAVAMFLLTLAHPMLMFVYFYILLMALIIFRFTYWKVL